MPCPIWAAIGPGQASATPQPDPEHDRADDMPAATGSRVTAMGRVDEHRAPLAAAEQRQPDGGGADGGGP